MDLMIWEMWRAGSGLFNHQSHFINHQSLRHLPLASHAAPVE
jgi:hypothetical protein